MSVRESALCMESGRHCLVWGAPLPQPFRRRKRAPSQRARRSRKVGFCRCCTCQEAAVGKAWRCRELLDKRFPPLYPLAPVCWCLHLCEYASLSLCTCVSACLLCGFLYLFVILDTGWLGWLGWLVGSWEGLSCWRFQAERSCWRLSHSFLRSSHKTWESLIRFPPLPRV